MLRCFFLLLAIELYDFSTRWQRVSDSRPLYKEETLDSVEFVVLVCRIIVCISAHQVVYIVCKHCLQVVQELGGGWFCTKGEQDDWSGSCEKYENLQLWGDRSV